MLRKQPESEELEISQGAGDYVVTFLQGIISGLGLGIGLYLVYRMGMKAQ